VGEALWPSRSDAWLLQGESWTAVVREQDEVEAYASAAGMSAAMGRRRAVLLLEQASEELSVVVMHRGKERDRHVWTGDEHDPTVLAQVLDTDPDSVAELLADPGTPAEVLAALARVLGVRAGRAGAGRRAGRAGARLRPRADAGCEGGLHGDAAR
jgi:hypothetical protein